MPSDTIGYNDGEFKASDGPRFHGAATAWVAGATGSGQTIAVIDTGLLAGETELAGRISADSTGINGNTTYEADSSAEAQPDSLHGTEVSMIAAAANNGTGTVGIAYNATIMMIRADDPGTCDTGCNFGDISDGIDWAVDHGATVINISLGGSGATTEEKDAILRAANAGIVVVVAAGNDAKSSPDIFARQLATAGNGNVIIAGSVDSGGQLSSYSNKAGSFSEYYLAALGRVTVAETSSIYEDQGTFNIAGTSFSAPQIAGAVALIKQAFPSMTGQEIVSLLLETAQDVGVAGEDSTYGMGILDIYEAFQPQGTTSLAGSKTALAIGGDTGVTSAAMGDALAGQSLQTLVLDKYRRAYQADLNPVTNARPVRRLTNAVGQAERFVSLNAGKTALAFTLDNSPEAQQPWPTQLMLSREDADKSKVLAARVAMKLSPNTDFGFAYAESADGLVGQLQGQDRPAFLIAQSATGDDGLFRTTDAAFALRRKLDGWGLTLSAESGSIVSAGQLREADDVLPGQTRDPVRSFALSADRAWGPLEASLALSWMDEDRTVLGARFNQGLAPNGAETAFIDANAGWNFADGWRIGGAWRHGFTRPNAGGIITSDVLVETSAWSVDLQHTGVFGSSDSLALRFAQPLRVESGGLAINLPVGYSYETLLPTYATQTLLLSPSGRELMSEIAWHGPLWGGFGSASLYFRRDPGHYSSLPDDKGAAVKWNTKF